MPELSPRDAAAYLRQGAQALRRGIRRAEGVTMREALSTAKRYTSGFVSPRYFRKQGHPLARRHGAPQLDVLPINARRGGILHGWQASGGRIVDGALVYTLTNVAPHAGYQYDPDSEQPDGGTKYTFGRPVPQAVAEAITPGRILRLQVELKAAFPP